MSKIQILLIKLCFFMHFWMHSNSIETHPNDINFHLLDFEKIKNQLFSNDNFQYMIPNGDEKNEINPHYDELKCDEELKAIQSNLVNFNNSDMWALKRKQTKKKLK